MPGDDSELMLAAGVKGGLTASLMSFYFAGSCNEDSPASRGHKEPLEGFRSLEKTSPS